MTQIRINASTRQDRHDAANHRLRKSGQFPAVLYGSAKEPTALVLDMNELTKIMNKAHLHGHMVMLDIDGKTKEPALVKDIQMHPCKPIIYHMDFQRAGKGQKIHCQVPLNFIKQDSCPGVKKDGGQCLTYISEIDISCAAEHLPESITVDLGKMKLDEVMHLSDIALPKNVSLHHAVDADHDPAIAAVHKPKVSAAASDSAADASQADLLTDASDDA